MQELQTIECCLLPEKNPTCFAAKFVVSIVCVCNIAYLHFCSNSFLKSINRKCVFYTFDYINFKF